MPLRSRPDNQRRAKRLQATVAHSVVVALAAAALTAVAVTAAPPAFAAAPLLCDQNTLYGIDSSGQVDSINVTTGAATAVIDMSPAYNGLGVTPNGADAWAYDGADQKIVHYKTSDGSVTTINSVDSSAPTSIIRGAINPATGLFYYAGNGASAYLGAYDARNGATIGQIGQITGLSNANGDFAFSTLGLLFVVSGNNVYRVNGTVPTTAGNASLSTSLLATLPSGTNSPGIAFSTDGYLYVSNGATIIKLDPAAGTQVGATINISGGFNPIDLASCNYPNTISVQTTIADRVTSTDQFGLSVTGGSISSGNTATTSGTTNGLQNVSAGAALAIPTRTYTVAETASGTTTLANYNSTYSCVNVNTAQVVASGSGYSGTFTFPAATASTGTDVVCTFTNTPKTATITLSAALLAARESNTDQFTVAIRSTSASGPVVSATTGSTTAGTGSTVTTGTGTTGATTLVANRPYYFTEAMAAGSSSAIGQYGATITCTDANSLQTDLPSAAAFTGSYSLTPISGSAISCTVSNGTLAPTVRVTNALTGNRFSNSDQFTAAIHTGSAAGPVVNATTNATTTGTNATVTAGTGTTGTYTGTAGTTYYVTDNASANSTRYTATITCTDGNGFQTGLPTNAAFTGSYAITPVSGSAISCAVNHTVGPAVLSLAESSPGSLTVGVPAAYVLTVTNIGGSASTADEIVDRLPPNIQYASASGAGWSCSATGTVAAGQLVTCIGSAVNAAATSTLTINVTVTPGAAGTTVTNRAIVDTTGGTTAGDPTTCTATGTPAGCAVSPGLVVGNGVTLSLVKTNPATLTVGVGSAYSLTVTNSGTASAAHATVKDTLPANLTFDFASGATCTAAGQVLTCTVTGPIAASGGTATFTVDVTPTPAAAATSVANRATVDVTGGTSPGDPTSCTSTGTPAGCAVAPSQTVAAGVGLSLSKTNPTSLTVGQPGIYTLTVTNDGDTAAASATVTDVLPANLTYTSAAGATCSASGQLVTCTVSGPIAAGAASSFTVTVTPQVAAAGNSVVNKAAVDSSGGTEPFDPSGCTGPGTPDTGCATTPAIAVGNGVDLTLTKTNPTSLTVGQPGEYTLTVTNDGTGLADSVTVQDALPAGLTYDSASGATCSAVGQVLTCTLTGPIAAGASSSFTVTVTPSAAAADSEVANKASVDPTGGIEPPDASTCTGADEPTEGCAVSPELPVGNGVDLALTKSNPDSLTVGVAANYSLTITNNGTGPADSATVEDELPAGLSFNSASGATCSASGQVLTCNVLGPISALGGTKTFTVNVTPQAAAADLSVVNKASVDSTGGTEPPNPSTCTGADAPTAGCAVTPGLPVTGEANLVLAKASPEVLTVGVPATYVLTVTNDGSTSAESATVTDQLPPNLTFISATDASCVPVGQVLTCTVSGPVAPGQVQDFTITVMPRPAAAGTSVVNRAAVDPTGGDAPVDPSICVGPGEPSAGCAVTPARLVGSGVLLSMTKTNPVALTVGIPSAYTLRVTNNGTGPATDAAVTDMLPAGLKFHSADGGTCKTSGQAVNCVLSGTIAPQGGSRLFTVTVVPMAQSQGAAIVNRAAVDPAGGVTPPSPSACTTTSSGCAVTPPMKPVKADLTLVETASLVAPAHGKAAVGDRVHYGFQVRNTGPVVLNDISVSATKVGAVTCPVTSLEPDESTNCTSADYTVVQADVDAGSVINAANAIGTPTGCQKATCRVSSPQSAVSTLTLSVAGVTGAKSADVIGGGQPRAGSTVRYTVTVTNTGTMTIQHVTSTDPMLVLICPDGPLAPGASTRCVGDHVVTSAEAVIGRLVNTAVVIADAPGGQIVTEPTNTVVNGVAPLALSYTGLPGRQMLVDALLLLLAGLAFLLLGRRRRGGRVGN